MQGQRHGFSYPPANFAYSIVRHEKFSIVLVIAEIPITHHHSTLFNRFMGEEES